MDGTSNIPSMLLDSGTAVAPLRAGPTASRTPLADSMDFQGFTRIHPQGKVAPRMFLELARPKSDWIGLGSGGVPVLISSIPKTIGFFIADSICAFNYN